MKTIYAVAVVCLLLTVGYLSNSWSEQAVPQNIAELSHMVAVCSNTDPNVSPYVPPYLKDEAALNDGLTMCASQIPDFTFPTSLSGMADFMYACAVNSNMESPPPSRDNVLQLLEYCWSQGYGSGGSAPPPSSPPPSPPTTACGNDPLFVAPFADLSSIAFIVPLGNLNPPGHTFPSDHVYIGLQKDANGNVINGNVSAPGNIVVNSVSLKQYLDSAGNVTSQDYSLYFSSCTEVQTYFHHLVSLSPNLSQQVGGFENATCTLYNPGDINVRHCMKTVNISLAAGDLMGTAGSVFDLGMYDNRIAPLAYVDTSRIGQSSNGFDEYHVVCPIDYFSDSNGLRSGLQSKLGGWGGNNPRTVAPICGKVMQDVPYTAQGRWYNVASTDRYSESAHLALVHDNVDPTIATLSTGTSVPGLSSGTYSFYPNATGRIDRDFKDVVADGTVYCFDNFTYLPNPSAWQTVILIQLADPYTLWIEKKEAMRCTDVPDWSFTTNRVQFSRFAASVSQP